MTWRAIARAVAAAALVGAITSGCAPDQARIVTVAIVDTGIDVDAPLGGRLDRDASASVLPDSSGIDDVDGHGTEMASVVHGAAPGALLVVVKAVGAEGTTDAVLAAGIDHAVGAGASVVLVSMAGAEPLPRTRTAIRRASTSDVVVVVAAGNDGLDLDEHPAYPAAYAEPNLIAVAAVDVDGALLGTSNRGPTVTAEGQGTAVATCTIGGRPATTGATSAAAALVAGAAAQALEQPTSLNDLRAIVEASPALATADPCT